MRVLDTFAELANERPDTLAVLGDDGSYTWRELHEEVRALAARFPARALIATSLCSGRAFVATALACFQSGAILFPLPHTAKVGEIDRALAGRLPDALITERDDLDHLTGLRFTPFAAKKDTWSGISRPHVGSSLPAATAMVQLTSGSTGVPKALLLSRDNIEAGIEGSTSFLERFARRAVFITMPMFHAMGGAVTFEHLSFGSPIIASDRFVPGEHKKRMLAHQCALICGAPSYFRLASRMKLFPLEGLEAAQLGSAPSERALLETLHGHGLEPHLRYGLSESFGALTRRAWTPNHIAGDIGEPLGDAKVKPLPNLDDDPAELVVRAGAVATSVWLPGNEIQSLVDSEGQLHTGDLARADGAAIRLSGRQSQFIKSQGHRIDPSEIEQLLCEHPSVNEACVVAIPDKLKGNAIVAIVEGNVDDKELRARVKESLSAYKAPSKYRIVESLPRTPAGKPDRNACRELFLSPK